MFLIGAALVQWSFVKYWTNFGALDFMSFTWERVGAWCIHVQKATAKHTLLGSSRDGLGRILFLFFLFDS